MQTMTLYLLAAVLFVVGLAAIGAATFGRKRNRRLLLASLGAGLWLTTSLLYGCTASQTEPATASPTPISATSPTAPRGQVTAGVISSTVGISPLEPTATLPSTIAISPLETASALSSTIAISPLETSAALPSIPGRIAFHAEVDEQLDIFSMNADGTDLRQLTNAPDRDIEPAWSPDGRSIVFSSGRDDTNNLQLYMMNADGSKQRPVMPFWAADQVAPRWSPDGKWILFHSNAEIDGQPRFEIYKVRQDGTGLVNLTNTPGNNFRGDWSPDGRRIVFVSERDGNRELYVMDADGNNQVRLTNHLADDNGPRWSPNGSKILFESYRNGANSTLNTIDAPQPGTTAPGESSVTLLTFPGFNSETAAWALNGEKVLFSADRDSTTETNWELFIADADGSDLQRLTQRAGLDRYPVWTP